MGIARRGQFISTLYVEKAAAHYRANHRIQAFALAACSMAIWPFKDAQFFTRILRILQSAIGKARA
jgi:hypothetical protein